MDGRFRHMHKHPRDFHGYPPNLMIENQMHLHRKIIMVDNFYQKFIDNVRDDLNEGKKEPEKGGMKENNQ